MRKKRSGPGTIASIAADEAVSGKQSGRAGKSEPVNPRSGSINPDVYPVIRAVFKTVAPYADDAMNLPVKDVGAAIPYYEKTFGFRVVSRQDAPSRSVILARDNIQIGLAENGGDSSQEGCFFEVDNATAAFEEINGEPPTESAFRLDKFAGSSYRVFFVVAPDGLCYMLGERVE